MTDTGTTSSGFAGLVGVAARDITPPIGIRARNWGPADWDEAEGVHRPFVLTALALSDGGSWCVMIGMDGTWWRHATDERRLREYVSDELEIDADALIISLSHTHAGAVLCEADAEQPGGSFIPAYLEHIARAAVEAGRESIERAEHARLEWGRGRCGLATNRDLVVDGRALVGYDPSKTADDLVTVGRVTTASGSVSAVIVNYACHPTTLAWENRMLSPDYVGRMREIVEAHTGALCLFLQGASGDLAPQEQYVGDPAVADAYGDRLGHAVLETLAGMPPAGTRLTFEDTIESGAPLAIWRHTERDADRNLRSVRQEVELAVRELPSLDELEEEWAGIDPASRAERLRRAQRLREGYVDGPSVRHPFWVWRIGDALLVAHPGEAYSKLQTTLRARYPGTPMVVANLTNGPGFVYLPEREAYENDAYAAWQTPLAAGCLEALERAATSTIDGIREQE